MASHEVKNASVQFSRALSSKGFYWLKKDGQSLSFQLVQQVSGGECERGGAAGVLWPQKGRPSPRRRVHRSIALSRLRYSSKAFTMVSSIFCAGVPGLKNLLIRSLGILNCST